MNSLPVLLLAVAAAATSYWVTAAVRRYALAKRILDVPNARSSHSQATPRGGGMAIVVATLAGFVGLGVAAVLPSSDLVGLCGAGALVAAVGFADDHRHLKRRWRLLAHFAAAAIIVVSIGGLPPVRVPGGVIDLGAVGVALATLYVVWLLNLTNFMDGIDGIAAVEAVTVSLGGVLLYVLAGPATMAWSAPLVLAAAAAGFLAWNWPPAKIFMGDGGSGFLGLTLAALSLRAAGVSPDLFWGWLILLAVFITDATITLTRRIIRGERVYEPHRTHAYQHAAIWQGQHKPVTMAVAAINVAWLLPIALLVASGRLHEVIGVLAAYAPLVYAAWRLGAGTAGPHRRVGEAIV